MSESNFRALCAELYQEFSSLYCDMSACVDFNDSYMKRIDNLCNRADAALATVPPDPSQISDGYHTFEELYEHRHALTLCLMKAMPELFWFSRRHNDGELAFGKGEWFIIGAELPGAGPITYHLPMRLWDSAQNTGAAELEVGRPWDGHTATDVADRLKAWAVASPEQKSSIDELIAGCKPLDPEMAEALTTEARWRLFGEDNRDDLPPHIRAKMESDELWAAFWLGRANEIEST